MSFIGHSQQTKLLFHPAESQLFQVALIIPLLITSHWHPTRIPLASLIKNAPKWWEVVPLSWLRLPHGSRWLKVARWESQQVLVSLVIIPSRHLTKSLGTEQRRPMELGILWNGGTSPSRSRGGSGGCCWGGDHQHLRNSSRGCTGDTFDFFHWTPEVYTVGPVEGGESYTWTHSKTHGRQQYVSMLCGQESKTG